ncbi:hypothetical protein ANCCAN_01392 [Ancylostoma caninum]|uniref:Peptidase S1 domain-containing protein n=1 Tax=Ancylostoma caninum TaxID=29170 RepID=A0A368HAG3_ANCCA|nr:hypothetical protein ANCCAN_01392 [Ancylostoma caninum]
MYGNDQSSRVPQVVAQKLYGVDEPSHKIMTRTFARAISREGSGGPLFQMVEGSHTLAGINIDGDAWRPKADFGEKKFLEKFFLDHITYFSYGSLVVVSDFKAQYVDVRAYLDWICKFSGVCPIEDDSNGEQSTDASNSTRKNSKNNIKS